MPAAMRLRTLNDGDVSSDNGNQDHGDGDVATNRLVENEIFRRACQNRNLKHKVWLHVYNLGTASGRLNDLILRDANLGAFHTGVEVLGSEFYHTRADPNRRSGIFRNQRPKEHPVHVYRESVFMGVTPLSSRQITQVLLDCSDAWPSIEYHPISKNCITFSEELLVKLHVPNQFPVWVKGLTKAGKSRLIYPIADWGWQWLKWWHLSNSSNQSEEIVARF